ncbi:MAG TPA: hypothetical protein VGJ54_19185 [Streptosporangiaceae bacterium]
MKIWTKRAVGVSAILGGLLVAGTVAASASDLSSIPLVGGALSGVTSQATSAAGAVAPSAVAPSAVQKGSSSKATRSRTPNTGRTGNVTNISGVGNGTKVGVATGDVTANVPVKACGNAVSVASSVTKGAQCSAGTAGSKKPKGHKPKSNPGAGTSRTTISGVLNGTTANLDLGAITANIPVAICGNSVAALSNITSGGPC